MTVRYSVSRWTTCMRGILPKNPTNTTNTIRKTSFPPIVLPWQKQFSSISILSCEEEDHDHHHNDTEHHSNLGNSSSFLVRVVPNVVPHGWSGKMSTSTLNLLLRQICPMDALLLPNFVEHNLDKQEGREEEQDYDDDEFSEMEQHHDSSITLKIQDLFSSILLISTLKRRKKKMNKHKLRKRRKLERMGGVKK